MALDVMRGRRRHRVLPPLGEVAARFAATAQPAARASSRRVRRPISRLIASAIIVLSVDLVACQQIAAPGVATALPSAPPIDQASFRSCVDREAIAVFKRFLDNARAQSQATGDFALYGYPIAVENDVIDICNPQLRPEGVNDNVYTTNPNYLYINAAVEAQQKAAMNEKGHAAAEAQRRKAELDAPRLKAEKDEETIAARTYYLCLARHAQILALASNEPAEVIADAAFPSCSSERQAVLDTYRRHNNTFFDSETMDMVDSKFKRSLLLEIIKARAQLAAPSKPPAPKPQSPI